MKRISLLLLSFAFVIVSGIHVSPASAQTSWQQINIPPLPAFHPQEPHRFVLPNGMVIFLQEDHELPLIDGIARIRGGSRSEPADKTGLIDMYSDVWRTGGTKTQTGDQKEALDHFQKALKIGQTIADARPDNTESKLNLSVLFQHVGETLNALGDLEGASRYFHQCSDSVESLLKRDPNNAEWR